MSLLTLSSPIKFSSWKGNFNETGICNSGVCDGGQYDGDTSYTCVTDVDCIGTCNLNEPVDGSEFLQYFNINNENTDSNPAFYKHEYIDEINLFLKYFIDGIKII